MLCQLNSYKITSGLYDRNNHSLRRCHPTCNNEGQLLHKMYKKLHRI